MRRALSAVILLACSASAQAPETVPVLTHAAAAAPDPCVSPRRFVGTWAGTMSCKTGTYPATVRVEQSREGCVGANWQGEKTATASQGVLVVSPTAKPEVFLMTAGQMTSILTVFKRGRRLTFTPDPNANMIAQLVHFSGSAELDPLIKKAFVRYTTSSPISAPDPCQGTMQRVQ